MSNPSFAAQPSSKAQRLPRVIHQEKLDHKIVYTIVTQETDRAFVGHFPNHPVLPGLVQLEWVDHFAKPLLGDVVLQNLEVIKFSRLVTPNLQLTLEVEKLASDGTNNKIQFRIYDEQGNFSSGKLVYPL